MELLHQIIKVLLVCLSAFGFGFASMTGGGDFPRSAPVPVGSAKLYVQMQAEDAGRDIFRPCKNNPGYRYGPSMILNKDGSLDVWFAANGPGDITDLVSYARFFDGGKKRTRERIALSPTPQSEDQNWTCDPGVIKIGDYYYIGYTSTQDDRGIGNNVYVGRSKTPEGPFQKWDGKGWGIEPAPLVKYTGDPSFFGVGEPSFVLLDDTLYIYYSWCAENGATTRVATADATDENWPATLVDHGECIPPKDQGDSTDVKYADAFGRFLAVFTEKRFSDDSYIAVWESFDGLKFRQSGFVKANTAKRLHNCGISGRSDGHIGAEDPVYLSYAYGTNWGKWPTRLQKVTLSLAEKPKLNPAKEANLDLSFKPSRVHLIPEVTMIKAEQTVYQLTPGEKKRAWTIAFDRDGFIFPLLLGPKYDGYDPSVIRMKGSRIYAVGEGSTRVCIRWRDFTGSFVVHVTE